MTVLEAIGAEVVYNKMRRVGRKPATTEGRPRDIVVEYI
jgi:hypothetical protein